MLETALIIVATILISHYLITKYRKKRIYRQRLLATNQIVRPDKPRLIPFIRALLSRGQP